MQCVTRSKTASFYVKKTETLENVIQASNAHSKLQRNPILSDSRMFILLVPKNPQTKRTIPTNNEYSYLLSKYVSHKLMDLVRKNGAQCEKRRNRTITNDIITLSKFHHYK